MYLLMYRIKKRTEKHQQFWLPDEERAPGEGEHHTTPADFLRRRRLLATLGGNLDACAAAKQ